MDNTITTTAQSANASANLIPLSANAGALAAPSTFSTRLEALPGRAKMAAAIGVAALAAVLTAMAMRSNQGDYKVLFSNLLDRDAAAITEKLGQMNVPYRHGDGGTALLVPAAQLYDIRFKLSAAGLPKGSVSGYELLDKAPFGQTQGQETSSRQRALEGELVRTIQVLSAVSSARVHLALPSQNGFFREQQKPSASVVLLLHPGRQLDAGQVAGVVHVISSSVPELNPKAVTVVDGNGVILSNPPDNNTPQGLDAQQVQYLRDVEATHLKRVLQLLEPVVGRDNVRATVTAEVDFSQTESTSEEFKPNQGEAPSAVRAVRSEESTMPGTSTPTGVPGAQSNQAQAQPAAQVNGASQAMRGAQSGGAGGGSRRESDTRFEVDKKVSVTRNASGNVKRLNAAVVVNHRTVVDAKGKSSTAPLSPEEIEKLTSLAQQGIGFNKERGDSVRVVNAPFHSTPVPPAEAIPMWKEPWVQDLLRSSAAPAAMALVALVLIFGLIRPALKPALEPPPPAAEPVAKLDEVVAGDDVLPALGSEAAGAGGKGDGAAIPALGPPQNTRIEAVRAMARENPAAVANVLRGWTSGEAA